MKTRGIKVDFRKLNSIEPYNFKYKNPKRNQLKGVYEVERMISSRKRFQVSSKIKKNSVSPHGRIQGYLFVVFLEKKSKIEHSLFLCK